MSRLFKDDYIYNCQESHDKGPSSGMSQQCHKYEKLHCRHKNGPSKTQLETQQPRTRKSLEQLEKIG